eukprot:scaffold34641_cov156-Amphora_coffeaeformis.AAC.1
MEYGGPAKSSAKKGLKNASKRGTSPLQLPRTWGPDRDARAPYQSALQHELRSQNPTSLGGVHGLKLLKSSRRLE